MATNRIDPHEPVTNIAQESAATGEAEIEVGETGPGEDALEATDDGREAVAQDRVVEESTPAEADIKRLPDIGAASFREPDVVLETVHGPDNRVRITQTAQYPYRVNASLLITARDGSQWIGTAWFISPRTLITAGHCVYIKNSPVPGRDGWVKSIEVMPGRNESELPYGSATSTEFWTVRGWAENGADEYDYGAIILPTPLGSRTGTLGFGALGDARLRNAVANVTGYPGDKDPGQLWYDSKQIASVNANKVYYDIDTAGGESGAAVYIMHEGRRIAIAVHAYGGATTNSGTRISPPVFANLKRWKV